MGSPVLGDRIGFCRILPGYPGKKSRPECGLLFFLNSLRRGGNTTEKNRFYLAARVTMSILSPFFT